MQLLQEHLAELFEMCGRLLSQTAALLATHPGLAHLIHGNFTKMFETEVLDLISK